MYSEYTAKIRQLIQETPERVFIRTRHIEQDRIWREISEADVRTVLGNGKVEGVRHEDLTVLWRGKDVDGRLIELQCALISEENEDTVVIKETIAVRVGTAYEPGRDDAKARRTWLKSHSDYEQAPGGRVRKKMSVTRIGRKT